MGNREKAVNLLRNGLSPVQIARRGFSGGPVSLKTVLGYLEQKVGEGVIRRSDILFAVPHDIRAAIADGRQEGIDPDEQQTVRRYSDARFALGDMYEDIRVLEVGLHKLLRAVLEKKYGSEEQGWWREGIPETVRVGCQKKREQGQKGGSEPYSYTDLMDLRTIIEKKWDTIREELPEAVRSNRKTFLSDLFRLNEIRNLVMHPVRGQIPSEDDFEFVRRLRNGLQDTLPVLDKALEDQSGQSSGLNNRILHLVGKDKPEGKRWPELTSMLTPCEVWLLKTHLFWCWRWLWR